MPLQIYQLIHEAVTQSLHNAETQVQLDAMNVLNERAQVLYTQAKGVELDDKNEVKGSIFAQETLMPIRVDHLITDLKH